MKKKSFLSTQFLSILSVDQLRHTIDSKLINCELSIYLPISEKFNSFFFFFFTFHWRRRAFYLLITILAFLVWFVDFEAKAIALLHSLLFSSVQKYTYRGGMWYLFLRTMTKSQVSILQEINKSIIIDLLISNLNLRWIPIRLNNN